MGARVLVVLVLAVGCRARTPAAPSTATPPPAVAIAPDAAPAPDAPLPLDRDPPALIARELALYERVAEAVAADGTCATRASAIEGVATDAAPVIAARTSMIAAGLADARDAALDPERPRLAALVERIAQAGAPCASDLTFERALDHALAP